MRKLNMWARLGIVLSITWLVVVTGYFYISTVNQGTREGTFFAQVCEDTRKNAGQPPDDYACWTGPNSKFREGYNLFAKDAFPSALLVAAIPLPFLWLIFWGILATVRWVLRGRDITA